MPWQGQLVIGQTVRNYEEVRKVFESFGVVDSLSVVDDDLRMVEEPRTVFFRGQKIDVEIGFHYEPEGGADFPTRENHYTDAMVGFFITGRYVGSVLDKDCDHGRHEPFVFDPMEVTDILNQVRVWWPEAQAMIWTVFY